MELPYNPSNAASIIAFAKTLVGKSLTSEFSDELGRLNISNKDKGHLGKMIEKLFFKYEPNSNAEADFREAGLELKATGLKTLI